MYFAVLAEMCFLRALPKNAFCGFGGKMRFAVLAGKMRFSVLMEKCVCRKKKDFWFENNIFILKDYFHHLSF